MHPNPSPFSSIHTGWVVASGNQTPNLTFNTSGSPADPTSCAGNNTPWLPLLGPQRLSG